MSGSTMPSMMDACVLVAPHKIVCQKMPMPRIEKAGDAIVKVHQAGLCGSDLHWYRGHQDMSAFKPFIMGHEAVGEIVALGHDVKGFKIGDKVITPFSLSCGSCFYCSKGLTSRCVDQISIGNPLVPGAQADYLRVEMADSSIFHAPADIPDETLLLLSDILPTGYSTAMNARMLPSEERFDPMKPVPKVGVCVVIGCGPVGLCAISAANTMFQKVFATDLSEARLRLAEKHGATALTKPELLRAVKDATEGRGADAVLELVGVQAALDTALEVVRPYGVISVGGVHTQQVAFPGLALYGKNIRMQYGRCAHHNFFEPALKLLRDNRDLFAGFVANAVPFDKATEFYELFNDNKIAKTAFIPNPQ